MSVFDYFNYDRIKSKFVIGGNVMGNCKNCGREHVKGRTVCVSCGYQINDIKEKAYEDANGIWFFIGLLIPLVGFSLYFIWKNDRPIDSKYAGIGALIPTVIVIIARLLALTGLI